MLNFYIQKVESYLENYRLPVSPANLYEPLEYFLGLGGKRLRPVAPEIKPSM
jgi:geranylgeranyl diphosphate synthase type II